MARYSSQLAVVLSAWRSRYRLRIEPPRSHLAVDSYTRNTRYAPFSHETRATVVRMATAW